MEISSTDQMSEQWIVGNEPEIAQETRESEDGFTCNTNTDYPLVPGWIIVSDIELQVERADIKADGQIFTDGIWRIQLEIRNSNECRHDRSIDLMPRT